VKILKRNISKKVGTKDIEYIDRNHLYVKVLDYGLKLLLKEIIITPATKTWIWISFKEGVEIDISYIKKVCSFNSAINRSVNDVFATVYEFDTFEEMVEKWKKVKYNDEIKTVYKSDEPESTKGE